jgi:WD40 repeat protein
VGTPVGATTAHYSRANPAGFEGKLFAVAISPDGSTIAAGGYTGYEWEKTYSIYLFDRESGRLIRRLVGLPDGVAHLVYSPDGQYLAATLGGKNGVRVFSTVAYAPAGEDKAYGDGSTGADFDRTGKLVTTSYDGFICLYATSVNGSLRLVAKTKVKGGQRPYDVKFSPDGTRVAVGFGDPSKVAVLQASDLAPLFAPDTTGVNRFSLNSVAWSADSGTLYAGGIFNGANATQFIRAWADGGRGGYRDIAAAAGGGLISHILPLRDGGIIYGAANPAFGLIDARDRRQLFTTAAIANYMGLGQGLLLSPDGTGVGFAHKMLGQSPARFSLADRKLDTAPAGGLNWLPPKTEDSNIRVTDLVQTFTPKINGTALKLVQYEWSRNLALAPDRSAFLLGTMFYLRLFDRSGAERWKVEGPGDAWAVNVSSDGKLAVATFDDGTIRWYRMTDGKLLLSFFPHADRKRWVLWTPSGYYDASPGAEELIGWHVNNGKDQAADFFPVGQFRPTYDRPDVISKILETGDEAEAVRLADDERGHKSQASTVAQMLPPVVEIASPADNSEVSASQVTIRYSLRTPSGEPVTNVRALVDGRPVTGNRQLTREDVSTSGVRELKLSVPERDSEVSIIAENRFAASVPATIRLRWHGSAPTNEAFAIQPKLYVLAIGVSQYQNPSYSLKFAAKDAKDFAAAAATQKGFLYRDVVVKVLTNDQATKDNVLNGLDWIRKETTSKDVAMVFFAGHGLNDQNGVYYFLPYNTDLEKLLRTGVPFTDIKNTVQSLAGKTLFFIDTCHSGNVLGGRRGLADDLNGVINELASAESGAVVFAASTGNQYSLEDAKWNNGAFTKALVEGFTGRADYSGKGRITINMLDLYISERVKELTGGKQTPTTAKPNTVPDFPIAIKR